MSPLAVLSLAAIGPAATDALAPALTVPVTVTVAALRVETVPLIVRVRVVAEESTTLGKAEDPPAKAP
jgi:hypothetical protein